MWLARLTIVALCGLCLTGCSRLGLCTEAAVDSIESPTGRYNAEIVSKDCAGSSAVVEVVLLKTDARFDGRTAVAVFDAANPDRPANIHVSWRGEEKIIISAHGAKVWSFQPNWHGVRVMER